MSDDYTPSTDRVGAAATEPGAQITPAEFDRWLESVRAEERARIAQDIVREVGDGRAADIARRGA